MSPANDRGNEPSGRAPTGREWSDMPEDDEEEEEEEQEEEEA